ncbi:MAG: hypothetical protein WBX25_08910 [Rhodomicrobium sp.]
MTNLDLMLLPFELILLGTAAWITVMLVNLAISDFSEVMTSEHRLRLAEMRDAGKPVTRTKIAKSITAGAS